MSDSTYNGYADWTTWNVCLWIGNDEGLYSLARDYRHRSYDDFVTDLEVVAIGQPIGTETPDGAKWRDADSDDMAEFWAEL